MIPSLALWGFETMKLAFGVIVFIWMICGLVGAWWLDELDLDHWAVIAKGPITLARAYNDNPPDYHAPV